MRIKINFVFLDNLFVVDMVLVLEDRNCSFEASFTVLLEISPTQRKGKKWTNALNVINTVQFISMDIFLQSDGAYTPFFLIKGKFL